MRRIRETSIVLKQADTHGDGFCANRDARQPTRTMKVIRNLRGPALALAAVAALCTTASAQQTTVTTAGGSSTAVVTTTTRVGRVGTVTPDMMVMEAASGTEPVPYARTTRTVFVDETGATVPVESFRAGVPVTIHYSKDGERLVAERVVVQRRELVTPAATTTVVEPGPTVVTPTAEERVIVEKPAPAPVVKKKTTTTTTTTAPVKVREKDDEDDD